MPVADFEKNSDSVGQIRYMAVADHCQGKGFGKEILIALEEKAKELGLSTIELQARENAIDFYKACGYNIEAPSFLLWGIIQHFLMRKLI